MATKPSKVIATVGATADSVRISHTDFPDYQVEGDSIEDAAANLVQGLTRDLSEEESDTRRAALHQAIAEVQAFIERPTRE